MEIGTVKVCVEEEEEDAEEECRKLMENNYKNFDLWVTTRSLTY